MVGTILKAFDVKRYYYLPMTDIFLDNVCDTILELEDGVMYNTKATMPIF
jgi:hypothetical protein